MIYRAAPRGTVGGQLDKAKYSSDGVNHFAHLGGKHGHLLGWTEPLWY